MANGDVTCTTPVRVDITDGAAIKAAVEAIHLPEPTDQVKVVPIPSSKECVIFAVKRQSVGFSASPSESPSVSPSSSESPSPSASVSPSSSESPSPSSSASPSSSESASPSLSPSPSSSTSASPSASPSP